ncbi:MAG: hypothetical protein ACREAE_05045, partial [Nitrosopumilaceae archaeon]
IEKLSSVANHNDISTTSRYLKKRDEEDIMEIFGITEESKVDPTVHKTVILPAPVLTPVPVMLDRTDRKQPVMAKSKKKQFEQMALF